MVFRVTQQYMPEPFCNNMLDGKLTTIPDTPRNLEEDLHSGTELFTCLYSMYHYIVTLIEVMADQPL